MTCGQRYLNDRVYLAPMQADPLRRNNFDLLRLLAATQVAFLHGAEHLHVESILDLARKTLLLPGVPIFFVISGFLVTASYERSPSLVQYFANRFLRVYPALWFCFAIALSLVLYYQLPYDTRTLLLWCAAQVTVGQFWNPDFVRGWGVGVMNGSLWTIPVELQFYIAIPILYLLARAVRPAVQRLGGDLHVMAVVLVALGCYTSWSHGQFKPSDEALTAKLYGVTLIPWLYYFLVGLFLRRVHALKPSYFEGKVLHWGAAFVAWTVFAHYVLQWKVEGNYLNSVSIFIMGGATISLAFTKPDLSNKLLHHNDISYGMYIYHMIIVNLFIANGFTGTLGALVTMLVCTFALGFASWKLLEKPALALKKSSLLQPGKKKVAF